MERLYTICSQFAICSNRGQFEYTNFSSPSTTRNTASPLKSNKIWLAAAKPVCEQPAAPAATTKEDDYRKNAAETIELASRAVRTTDKGHLLALAEKWLAISPIGRTG